MLRILVLGLTLIVFADAGETKELYGFKINPSSYSVRPGSELALKNLTRARNQRTLNICYAAAAAAAYDIAYCKEENISCSNLSDNNRSSMLHMVAYDDKILQEYNGKITQSTRKSLIQSGYYPDIIGSAYNGGSAYAVLYNAFYNFSGVTKESCAPIDRFFKPIRSDSDPNVTDEDQIAEQASDFARAQKIKSCFIPSDFDNSISCLNSIENFLEINTAALKNAFAKGMNINIFLSIIIDGPSCYKAANKLILDGMAWDMIQGKSKAADGADESNTIYDYPSSVKFIKNALITKNPILVDGYCAMDLSPPTSAECKGRKHSLLITGFRTVCRSDKCIDEIRVLNSWGERWQRENNDGWVDAHAFLDRTFYDPIAFMWTRER